MRPIEIKGVRFLPAHINGICLWPCILYRPRAPDRRLITHERYHWHHALRWGVIPWYATYIALAPFYGTRRGHPLERPAYEAAEREG